MTIHSSARFEGKKFSYHNAIELNLTADKAKLNANQIVNLSLAKFKEKCENYFKLNFAEMCFFEVYFWDIENKKEVKLFEKTKQ